GGDTPDPTNTAPTASDGSATTDEDTAVTGTLTASDSDGDDLTYSVASEPTNGSVTITDASTGAYTYTPDADYNGSDSFTFTANDGTEDSEPATITITVDAVNDAPTFTKGANQSVYNNVGAQTVTDWATDISPGATDESGQTVTLSISNVTSTNTNLFASAPTIDNSGTLQYEPTSGETGTATVTVQAKDDGGTANGGIDTTTETFTIEVQTPPPNPVIDLNGSDSGVNASATFTEGDSGEIFGTGTSQIDPAKLQVLDPQEDIKTLKITLSPWTDKDGGADLEIDDSSVAQITAALSINSTGPTRIVTLTSSDPATTTAEDFENILKTLKYTNPTEAPDTTPRTITFEATDDAGKSTTTVATIDLTVAPVNDTPEIKITTPGPYSANQGSAFTIPIDEFKDVDADAANDTMTVTVSLTGDPSGTLAISGLTDLNSDPTQLKVQGSLDALNSETLTYTPGASSGTATLSVTIDDGGNGGTVGTPSTTTDIDVNLLSANPPPTVTPKDDIPATVSSAFNLDLTTIISDTDALDFSATEFKSVSDGSTPGWLSLSGSTLSGTPTNTDIGLIEVTVEATDTASQPGSDTFYLGVVDEELTSGITTNDDEIKGDKTKSEWIDSSGGDDTIYGDFDGSDGYNEPDIIIGGEGNDLFGYQNFVGSSTIQNGVNDNASLEAEIEAKQGEIDWILDFENLGSGAGDKILFQSYGTDVDGFDDIQTTVFSDSNPISATLDSGKEIFAYDDGKHIFLFREKDGDLSNGNGRIIVGLAGLGGGSVTTLAADDFEIIT
ncbi:Ig-like domain-containing protein, partial [Baaleninema sp.]|uniref:Ig-like domain-containing protein n=1 Tax=Baaleninema sp. TaxID=3101197 RepID=UPI003D06FC90